MRFLLYTLMTVVLLGTGACGPNKATMLEYNNAAVDAIEDGRHEIEAFVMDIDTKREEAEMRQMVAQVKRVVDSCSQRLQSITTSESGTFGEFQKATSELMAHYQHFADVLADSMVLNRLAYLELTRAPAEATNTAGMTPAQRREHYARQRAEREERRNNRMGAMNTNERLSGRFSHRSDQLQNAAAAAQKRFADDHHIELTEFGF